MLLTTGQKAAGWEHRGDVDAALQQQFANMQEYGDYTDAYTDATEVISTQLEN